MARDDHQLKFRVPELLKAKLEAYAEHHKRSMNAEIIARLESTFEELGPYSAIGMNAFVKRLEAGIEASEIMAQRLMAELRMAAGVVSRDDEPIRAAIQKYAAENNINLAVATQHILRDWLVGQGLLPHRAAHEDAGTEMSEGQMRANADEVRTHAADAADAAMVGMSATEEQKGDRRRELTDEPAVVQRARGKGSSRPPGKT